MSEPVRRVLSRPAYLRDLDATDVVEVGDVAGLAALVAGRGVVVLSGAGISTESGIPDYRGPQGALRRHAPMTYQEFTGSADGRRRYWARSFVGWRHVNRAGPNDGHRVVAALERAGFVDGVVTQNVDGLHAAAGSRAVVDLHGTLDRVVCLACGDLSDRAGLDDRPRPGEHPRAPAVAVWRARPGRGGGESGRWHAGVDYRTLSLQVPQRRDTVMRTLLLAIGAVALFGGAMLLLLIFALHGLAPDGFHVVINDREIQIGDLPRWQAMGAGMGSALAIAFAVIAVPIVLLLGVLLPLLLLVGALLLVIGLALGIGAIGMAPLLVPLLLLVWLWRRAQRRAARAAAQPAPAERSRSAASDTIDL